MRRNKRQAHAVSDKAGLLIEPKLSFLLLDFIQVNKHQLNHGVLVVL
jgi:hypothetical protein